MSTFSIVNRKLNAAEFAAYMADLPIGSWTKRVVLHNTANPTIAMRKGVFTPQNIRDLHTYYQFRAPVHGKPKGWSGGPHLFIDTEGIWVFNPLDRKGVHSPSFNSNGWGVEMLGNFATEAFDSGKGLLIHQNSVQAVAAMIRRLGGQVTAENFKIHKDDDATDHDCPGKNVSKSRFAAEVTAVLGGGTLPGPSGIPTKIVVYRAGAGPDPHAVVAGLLRGGKVLADRKNLAAATGLPFSGAGEIGVRAFVGTSYLVNFDATTDKVYLAER